MENSKYIITTKTNLVFIADCDYFGSIQGPYKMWHNINNNTCGDTFALNYFDAVNSLHKWIKDNQEVLTDSPKAKFNIYVIDGSIDKNDESIAKKVYTISASKAKKYLI